MMNKNNFGFQNPEMFHFLSNSLQQFSTCITKTIDKDAIKAVQLAAEEALRAYQQISQTLPSSIDLSICHEVTDCFAQMHETIASLFPEDYFEKLQASLEHSSLLADRLYNTWEQVETVVSEENSEHLCLDRKPLLTKIKQKVPLSFSDKISVLGLFLTILTFLLGLFPDTQLEELQQQNSEIISNQRQIIEIAEKRNHQSEESEKLWKSVYLLQDAISALHQEIQAFCEQYENVTDFSDLNEEPQQKNALGQKSDAQNDE